MRATKTGVKVFVCLFLVFTAIFTPVVHARYGGQNVKNQTSILTETDASEEFSSSGLVNAKIAGSGESAYVVRDTHATSFTEDFNEDSDLDKYQANYTIADYHKIGDSRLKPYINTSKDDHFKGRIWLNSAGGEDVFYSNYGRWTLGMTVPADAGYTFTYVFLSNEEYSESGGTTGGAFLLRYDPDDDKFELHYDPDDDLENEYLVYEMGTYAKGFYDIKITRVNLENASFWRFEINGDVYTTTTSIDADIQGDSIHFHQHIPTNDYAYNIDYYSLPKTGKIKVSDTYTGVSKLPSHAFIDVSTKNASPKLVLQGRNSSFKAWKSVNVTSRGWGNSDRIEFTTQNNASFDSYRVQAVVEGKAEINRIGLLASETTEVVSDPTLNDDVRNIAELLGWGSMWAFLLWLFFAATGTNIFYWLLPFTDDRDEDDEKTR